MRVTFVVASADLSGGCKVIAIHARMLAERGHEVLVVTPAPWRPTLRQRLRSVVKGTPLPRGIVRQGSHFEVQQVPMRTLEDFRPVVASDVPDADVIVATWWETAEWIRTFPASKGAKAYFVQGWERYIEGQPGDEVDATFRLPYHKIAISKFLADVAHELSGDTDVTLAPNAIDGAQFDAKPRGKQARPTLGFVYATSHWKGFDVCRAAVDKVRAEVPELRVVAFGAEKEVDGKPFPEGTEFEHRPAQDRIPQLYASADVWLSASRLEGFGLPALEAMGCRTPLVATRYAGPMDFVTPGENGFLVDVDDADALAARALEVMRMPEDAWKRMSEAAHRAAHAHSWADSSMRFEEGLLRAIEKR
ncbi:MAG: glycosyltransferase family 4 protein [Myxococcota bacterium]|nr:glycosyltransferase family 4 protein [Myxococcota bacterium]